MLADLRVAVYQVHLRAEEPLRLPGYLGSTLRGGFGRAFRRVACIQRGVACPDCRIRGECAYTYVFETPLPKESAVLRSYKDIPRPFVIEPPLGLGPELRAGEEFAFRFLLLGRARQYMPFCVLAFQRLAEAGLGKGRGRCALVRVTAVNPYRQTESLVYAAADGFLAREGTTVAGAEVEAAAPSLAGGRVALHYLTPTRLVHGERLAARPEFHVLVRALLRRVSALLYFHHGVSWEADFPALVARAEQVQLVQDETRWTDWQRYSSRQESFVEMGGVTGKAEYAGDLQEFSALLSLGELVHVGKGAVFGLGKYRLEPPVEGR